MPRPIRAIAVAVTAALLLSGCAAFETAAAVVDGTKIEHERFRRLVEFLAADPRFAEQFPAEQGETEKKDLARQLLTFLVHQVVIEREADARNIEASDTTVDQRLQQQISESGGENRFRSQLTAAGASRDDVEEFLRQQVLREQVARAVVAEGIPEAQLRQEYERRLTTFSQVDVAHILVSDAALAERLASQATPANFAELAREHSEDSGSAAQGGDLGVRPAAEFVEPFGSTALEIPVGEIGGPVETEFGHHIIWVKARTEAPFEEVRDQLLGEFGQEFFTKWVLDRVRRADVLVNPRYGVFDDRSGEVVDRTASTPLPTPGGVQVEP